MLVVIAVAPAAAILAYYLRIVRRAPEPWLRVAATCVLGGVAFFAAGWIEREAALYVPRSRPWLWCFAVVGPVEELLKLAAVLIAAPWPVRYERVSSGLMYGVAAGVGFACVENIAYVLEYGVATGVLRAVTAVPSHALQSAIFGLGLGVVHRTRMRRLWPVVFAVLAAIVLHALYDALLLAAGQLRGLAVGIVFLEAIVVRYAARRVLERDLQADMDLLGSVPLFEGVKSSSLRTLAAGATRIRVAPGAAVVRQGNRGEAMFQIMRGDLEVRIDGETVTTMQAGDFFGELALLTEQPRSADVVARSEALVMRVHRDVFLDAVDKDRAFADVVVERARDRMDEASLPSTDALVERARQAAERPPEDKLASALGGVDVLRELSSEDLVALARACVRAQRGPAARLVRAGRPGIGFCLILSGGAVATLGRRRLTELVEGDFFGEIGLLTGWNATATVTSSAPVELAVLRWIDLEPIVAKNPQLGLHLLDALEVRARRGMKDPSQETSLGEKLWRTAARLSRLLSPWSERSEALFREHPDIRSLPRSTVETLSEYDTPVGLEPGTLADAIARCPSVLRFYARLAIRRVVAS